MNKGIRWAMAAVIAVWLLGSKVAQPVEGQGTPTPSQSLAEQAGFSSPVLDEFQRAGMRYVAEKIAFSAYGHDYRLLGFRPVAVPTDDGNRLSLGAAMLFQVDGNTGTLLWRKDVGGEYITLDAKQAELHAWPLPGDWETTGNIEFGVRATLDSTCPLSILNVYELHADGSVHARFTNRIPPDHVVQSITIQEDGSLLLTASDQRGRSMGMCVYPRMTRYFELRRDQLTDVSKRHTSDYMADLGEDIYAATTWINGEGDDWNSQAYAARLMEILLIYDALGERDAGYVLVRELASNALSTGRIKQNMYLDQVFLPTMAQLYAQKLPFVEPAYTGPKPIPAVNWYP